MHVFLIISNLIMISISLRKPFSKFLTSSFLHHIFTSFFLSFSPFNPFHRILVHSTLSIFFYPPTPSSTAHRTFVAFSTIESIVTVPIDESRVSSLNTAMPLIKHPNFMKNVIALAANHRRREFYFSDIPDRIMSVDFGGVNFRTIMRGSCPVCCCCCNFIFCIFVLKFIIFFSRNFTG